jgi:hypothetical protein
MVIDEVLDDEPASPETDTTSPESDHYQSFIFGYSSSNVDLRPLHPLPSQMPYYLQVFKERVDPIIKLLHMPTMEKAVKQVQENPESMSRSREALMFSMYFAVVTRYVPVVATHRTSLTFPAACPRTKLSSTLALKRSLWLTVTALVWSKHSPVLVSSTAQSLLLYNPLFFI